MFTHLKDLLPRAASKHNFTAQLLAAEICEKYRKQARAHLGPAALAHTWPQHFKNMILTVGVENSLWAQEVHLVRHKIFAQINQEFGRSVIAQIRIRIDQKRDY